MIFGPGNGKSIFDGDGTRTAGRIPLHERPGLQPERREAVDVEEVGDRT